MKWLEERNFKQDHSKLAQPNQRHWYNGNLTVFHDPNMGWHLGYKREDKFGRLWDIIGYAMTEDEVKTLVDVELAKSL
jgi:hypothetical protein